MEVMHEHGRSMPLLPNVIAAYRQRPMLPCWCVYSKGTPLLLTHLQLHCGDARAPLSLQRDFLMYFVWIFRRTCAWTFDKWAQIGTSFWCWRCMCFSINGNGLFVPLFWRSGTCQKVTQSSRILRLETHLCVKVWTKEEEKNPFLILSDDHEKGLFSATSSIMRDMCSSNSKMPLFCALGLKVQAHVHLNLKEVAQNGRIFTLQTHVRLHISKGPSCAIVVKVQSQVRLTLQKNEAKRPHFKIRHTHVPQSLEENQKRIIFFIVAALSEYADACVSEFHRKIIIIICLSESVTMATF